MSLTVTTGDPHDPATTALLQASHALMQELFPGASNHFLSIDALCGDNIRFLVAKNGNQIVGCGAIALKKDYGEVKSMFVEPDERGRGIADILMAALISTAKVENLSLLRLETGHGLAAALRLYEKHGFTYRGPFGSHTEDPLSLFMEKQL